MGHKHKSTRGFTLIEVMIVVAIIGILAAIAYPSYREQVARSRRADAKAVLLENAQWLERQYTVSNRYNLMGDGATTISSNNLPVKEAPKEGATKYYTIQFTTATSPATNPDAGSFTLEAVPQGTMSGDKCGSFRLTSTGAKSVTSSVTNCWER